MADVIPLIGIISVFCFVFYKLGAVMGAADKLEQVAPDLEAAYHYRQAVDDLDRWCGQTSTHAGLIARHLKARGEQAACNAGTPNADEACTVSGLREQLRRLDAAHQATKEPHSGQKD